MEREVLAISAKGESDQQQVDPLENAAKLIAEKTYGSDLNSSDILFSNQNDQQIMAAVAEEFEVPDITGYRYPAHHTTTSRKILIDTEDGSYFLKQKAPYASPEKRINFSGTFQNYLAEAMPDQIPPLIESKGRALFVTYGVRKYILMREVDGGMFMGHHEQIRDAGRTLAKIHNLSEDFIIAHRDALPDFKDSKTEALGFIEIAESLKGTDADEHKLLAMQSLRGIIDSIETAPDAELRSLVTHGDYTPSNLLFLNDKVVGVLDFDNVSHHLRVRDIAEALMTFGGGISYKGNTSSLRHPIATKLQYNLVKTFLDGYDSELEIPLTSSERIALPNELALAWTELMGLGIVRGDFAYEHILQALQFTDNLDDLRAFLNERY